MILCLYTLVGLTQLHHYVSMFTDLSEVIAKASEFYKIKCFSQNSPALSVTIWGIIFKFSKAANLFETLNWNCFLTSSSLSYLRLNLSTLNACIASLLTTNLSPTFGNTKQWSLSHSAPPERWHIAYTRMQSPIYQYVINLVVSLSIRRGPGQVMNVWVSEYPDFKVCHPLCVCN